MPRDLAVNMEPVCDLLSGAPGVSESGSLGMAGLPPAGALPHYDTSIPIPAPTTMDEVRMQTLAHARELSVMRGSRGAVGGERSCTRAPQTMNHLSVRTRRARGPTCTPLSPRGPRVAHGAESACVAPHASPLPRPLCPAQVGAPAPMGFPAVLPPPAAISATMPPVLPPVPIPHVPVPIPLPVPVPLMNATMGNGGGGTLPVPMMNAASHNVAAGGYPGTVNVGGGPAPASAVAACSSLHPDDVLRLPVLMPIEEDAATRARKEKERIENKARAEKRKAEREAKAALPKKPRSCYHLYMTDAKPRLSLANPGMGAPNLVKQV